MPSCSRERAERKPREQVSQTLTVTTVNSMHHDGSALHALTGFMTKAIEGVCDKYTMTTNVLADPITSHRRRKHQSATALRWTTKRRHDRCHDERDREIHDRERVECKAVSRPGQGTSGRRKVMPAKYNLAAHQGLSEIYYPEQFKGLYQRPAESRKFSRIWMKRIAALQLATHAPLHEFLARLRGSHGRRLHPSAGRQAQAATFLLTSRQPSSSGGQLFCEGTVVQAAIHEMRYAGPEKLCFMRLSPELRLQPMISDATCGVGDYTVL